MKKRVKISKPIAIRLLSFAILLMAAFAGDLYLKSNPIDLTEITAQSDNDDSDQNHFYAVTSSSSLNSTIISFKLSIGKLLPNFHDKFLQKAHQCKNLQLLKEKLNIPSDYQFTIIRLIRLKNLFYYSTDTEEFPLS